MALTDVYKRQSQYKLIRYYKISSGQLNRIRHNNYISTSVIDKMCNILDCQPSDIMEVFPDDVEMCIRDSTLLVYCKSICFPPSPPV